jgi:hypothetical protein
MATSPSPQPTAALASPRTPMRRPRLAAYMPLARRREVPA